MQEKKLINVQISVQKSYFLSLYATNFYVWIIMMQVFMSRALFHKHTPGNKGKDVFKVYETEPRSVYAAKFNAQIGIYAAKLNIRITMLQNKFISKSIYI